MSDKPQVSVEKQDAALDLTESEKQELLKFFSSQDLPVLKASAEAIMMLVRAFNGLAPEPSDVISKLIDVKNPMERSRFPTFPILQRQVYLRLVAAIHPEARSCKLWADDEASALIQYKGDGRKEWVEATKAAASSESSQITIGMPQAQQQERRGLLRRREKKEPQELEE